MLLLVQVDHFDIADIWLVQGTIPTIGPGLSPNYFSCRLVLTRFFHPYTMFPCNRF